jgi:branched-subunit amino acid transport protein
MIWVIMLSVGVITYLTRLSFIWLFERIEVPPLLQRGLRFVPPAVLSVFIFQQILMPSGKLELWAGNARLWAGIIAALVAWKTRSILLTILAGMGALLLLQAVFHL